MLSKEIKWKKKKRYGYGWIVDIVFSLIEPKVWRICTAIVSKNGKIDGDKSVICNLVRRGHV